MLKSCKYGVENCKTKKENFVYAADLKVVVYKQTNKNQQTNNF